MTEWNEDFAHNAPDLPGHVIAEIRDGGTTYWAHVPVGTTADQAIDDFVSTACYGDDWSGLVIRCQIWAQPPRAENGTHDWGTDPIDSACAEFDENPNPPPPRRYYTDGTPI